MAGEPLVLLGLREGRVLEAGALARPRRDAAHADAARRLRPRRLRQPRLLAARPGARSWPSWAAARRASASRSWSRRERLAARAESAEDRMQTAYERLQPASQSRYRALVVQCREILGLGAATATSGRHRLPRRQPQPAAVALPAPARLARGDPGHARARRPPAARGGHRDPEGAPRRGRPTPRAPLARSLKATLEIQEKRLANLETATNNLAVIDAELERIEQQVRLVREESAVSRLARGALGAARLRLVDAQRDLALDGPARGAVHRHGQRRLRRPSRCPPCRAPGEDEDRRRHRRSRARARAEAEVAPASQGSGARSPPVPRRTQQAAGRSPAPGLELAAVARGFLAPCRERRDPRPTGRRRPDA